jgi:ribonuclease P protein component
VGGAAANSNPQGIQNPVMPAKFSRGARLRRRADFERIYKQGRRHFGSHITAFYLARPGGNGLRVGFTVGRAIGNAVDRNRIKRRLREAVRLHWPPSPVCADVVIHPKKSVLKLEFTALSDEITRAFEAIQMAMAKRSAGRESK